MRFGEYVKQRRKQLHLRQQDFKDFDQSYISRVEKGEYNPTKRETIEQLALMLQIPKQRQDWFWVYSLLDRDPDLCFGKKVPVPTPGHPVLADGSAAYTAGDEIMIAPGESEQTVALKLGPPTRKVRIPGQVKWLYEAEGLHVTFEEGQVRDVVFK